MTLKRRFESVYREGFTKGCLEGYNEAVDKAVEWLECYIGNYLFVDIEDVAGIRLKDFIKDFKQAMDDL